MASKPQTYEEILAEMEAIDQLELKGGIAAASQTAKAEAETAKAEAETAKAEAETAKAETAKAEAKEDSKPKYKMPGLSREQLGYQ